MRSLRRILVGIDLDDAWRAVRSTSERAGRCAAELAARTGARVVLYHSTWYDVHEERMRLVGGLGDEGRAGIDALRGRLASTGGGVEVDVEIGDERPWLGLIRRAGRGDLVVVGRRRESTRDGALGSVTVKCLRKCPASVWVARPDGPPLPSKVIAATDLSPVGDRAVRYALSFAELAGAEVHVVHAWSVPIRLQLEAERVGPVEHARRLREIEANAEQHVRRALADVDGERLHLLLSNDAPSHAIRAAVEALQADLLVMGTVSRGGIAGLLVGNTAEKLLGRVSCAILAIKPADFRSPVVP